jgi:hypothetical protein
MRIGPVWDEAMELAKQDGDSVNRIITDALRRYVRARRRRELKGETSP